MRVFLAGATGVIGRRLVPLLTASGHQVTGLARSAAATERVRALGAEAALADVFDAAALARAVRAAAPDVVIHQLTDLSAGRSDANADPPGRHPQPGRRRPGRGDAAHHRAEHRLGLPGRPGSGRRGRPPRP